MEVASKGLQEVNRGGQTAETIFVSDPPEQAEEANRLVALRCCLGYSFRNCLEDSLEPFRLDVAKNLAPEEKLGSNGFWCSARPS